MLLFSLVYEAKPNPLWVRRHLYGLKDRLSKERVAV